MSPHGVFQEPKSAVNLSDAAESARNITSAEAFSGLPRPPLLCSSVPQNTARDVGMDFTLQRRSHPRSIAICSDSLLFIGSAAGSASHALIRAGMGLSNHVR